MKCDSTTELKMMSGEQLLLVRLCGTPDVCTAIERELDRRSVVAQMGEILTRRESSTMKRRHVA